MAFLTIQGEFDKLRRLFEGPFWPSLTFVFSLAMRLVIEVAVAMLALADTRLPLPAPAVHGIPQDVQGRGQGRAEDAGGGSPGQEPAARAHARAPVPEHGGQRAQGRRGHHEPDPLRRGPRVGQGEDGRADRHREGRWTRSRCGSSASRPRAASPSWRTGPSRGRCTRTSRSATRYRKNTTRP